MAGSDAHWRDVYSVEAWRQLLLQADVDPARQARIEDITQALTAYHGIPKPHVEQFGARRSALSAVRDRALAYLDAHVDEVEKGHVQKGRQGLHKAAKRPFAGQQVIAGSLDPWVRSLERRAQKKSAYLQMLNDYYASTKARETTAEDFRSYLAEKHQHDRAGASKLPLTAGTKFEKFDPMHRQAEVHVDDAGDFQMAMGVDIPMNNALGEWIGSARKSTPFFVWLEDHDICTKTRYLDAGWVSVLRVKYEADPGVQELLFHGGQVRIRPREDTAGGVPLDTSTMQKGSKAGLAFVWCIDGTLLVHRHLSGTFHHSSFQAGGKVRCAGTLIAAGGKITHIDSDSGHYRPTDRHFLTLLTRIRRANCLAADATVSTFASNELAKPAQVKADHLHMQTVADYRGWAREQHVKQFPLIRPLHKK